MQVLNIQVPAHSFRVTQDIINKATPDHRGLCMGAIAIRESLKDQGVSSIHVTPDTINFTLPTKVNGRLMDIRYGWKAPAKLSLYAHTFDEVAYHHGTEAARKQAKPFTFRVQSVNGWAALPDQRPRGALRKKRTDRPKRAASAHERVVRCARRYHPVAAYPVSAPAGAARKRTKH